MRTHTICTYSDFYYTCGRSQAGLEVDQNYFVSLQPGTTYDYVIQFLESVPLILPNGYQTLCTIMGRRGIHAVELELHVAIQS